MTSSPATESALLPCPFCNAGETAVEERRMPPTMKGPGSVISVTVRHWCPVPEGQPTGMHVSMHGRDRESAIAAWNRRPPVASPTGGEMSTNVDTTAMSTNVDTIRSEGLEKK